MDSCVEFHKKVAVSAGATREEMLEAGAIGGLVRMDSGFASAFMMLEDGRIENPVGPSIDDSIFSS